jgi:hypothetical protein
VPTVGVRHPSHVGIGAGGGRGREVEDHDGAASSAALRSLYELTTRVSGVRDLDATLQAVVDGVVEAVGFGVAAVNYVRADGMFEIVAVAGSEEAREALLGRVTPPDNYVEEFARPTTGARCGSCPTTACPTGRRLGAGRRRPRRARRLAPARRPLRPAPRHLW